MGDTPKAESEGLALPDYFKVVICPGCGNLYPEPMLNAGLCDGCDMSDMDMFDDDNDDSFNYDPNVCSDCGMDTVQVQNGDWVCPSCDLWEC